MEFVELMKGFGSSFGLTDFRPGEDGVWNVEIDGMEISFAELADPARVRTLAPVCELPEKGRETLQRVLLEAMFMGRATGGALFFLNEGSDTVFLQRTDPLATLGADDFNAALERFVNVLEQWRKLVAEFSFVATEIDAAERAGSEEARQFGLDGFLRV